MKNNIGERIRALRETRSENQSSLALFLGVSVQCVSKWERGKSVPDIELLPSIAAYYDISIDELFNVSDIKKESNYEKDIEDIKILSNEKRWLDEAEKAITLIRRYPAKTELCFYLLDGVIRSVISETEIPEDIIEKAISFGERAYRRAEDISVKMKLARELALLLYCKSRTSEADAYYNVLVSAECSRETLVPWKYKGKERREKLIENTAVFSSMLADAYTKLAYNTNVSEEVIQWLDKSVSLYNEAEAMRPTVTYHKVMSLIMLDKFCTYVLMCEYGKALTALREAEEYAEKHGITAEYKNNVINHSARKPQMWDRPELKEYLDKIKGN